MDHDPYDVEIEPEIQSWLHGLADQHYRKVEEAVSLLAETPTTLGEPRSRHLGGRLRELRLRLDGQPVRITYWLAPGLRIVLLTVFRKTRMREATEVERAHRAQKVCESEHPPAHEIYTRSREERGGR